MCHFRGPGEGGLSLQHAEQTQIQLSELSVVCQRSERAHHADWGPCEGARICPGDCRAHCRCLFSPGRAKGCITAHLFSCCVGRAASSCCRSSLSPLSWLSCASVSARRLAASRSAEAASARTLQQQQQWQQRSRISSRDVRSVLAAVAVQQA